MWSILFSRLNSSKMESLKLLFQLWKWYLLPQALFTLMGLTWYFYFYLQSAKNVYLVVAFICMISFLYLRLSETIFYCLNCWYTKMWQVLNCGLLFLSSFSIWNLFNMHQFDNLFKEGFLRNFLWDTTNHNFQSLWTMHEHIIR